MYQCIVQALAVLAYLTSGAPVEPPAPPVEVEAVVYPPEQDAGVIVFGPEVPGPPGTTIIGTNEQLEDQWCILFPERCTDGSWWQPGP
jgi:hypothetical protein